MRTITCCVLALVFAAFAAPPLARAEGYLEAKDNRALEALERSLGKLDKVAALFDGAAIPEGADLREVERLLDQLRLQLRVAAGAFADLSASGLARPDAQKLKRRFDDLVRYRDALGPAHAKASADAAAAARKQHADEQAAGKAAHTQCTAFHQELRDAGIYSEAEHLMQLANTGVGGWDSVDSGARFKAALGKLADRCAKPAYAEVDKACERSIGSASKGFMFCTLPARGAELMQKAVKNLIAHHLKHSGPTTVARFESDQGWVAVDGVPTWHDYFTGSKLRGQLKARIAPLLAQAGMAETDDDGLFDKLAGELAALEAKAKELGPKWDLPGAACAGPGCGQARTFVAGWYKGSTIRRFLHTQPGWKILTNDFGVPTYRERYGYALVQVKGEPLCQLRTWTLSEQHAGGGRYSAARDVTLGSVRWQACK